MTDHPSTFKAQCTDSGGFDWDHHASVHRRGEGQGLFYGMKGLHHGTVAEMVALVSRMREGEREQYVIVKSGDHTLETGEIMALAARKDFPG